MPGALGDIHIRTMCHKRPNRIGTSCPRRGQDDGVTVGHGGVRVGSRLEQCLDHRRVTVDGGERQRRDVEGVGGHHVGPSGNQEIGHVQAVEPHRPVERRRAVRLRSVHIDTVIQQCTHGGRVRLLDRLHERDDETCAGRVQRQQQGQTQADDDEARYGRHVRVLEMLTSHPRSYPKRVPVSAEIQCILQVLLRVQRA